MKFEKVYDFKITNLSYNNFEYLGNLLFSTLVGSVFFDVFFKLGKMYLTITLSTLNLLNCTYFKVL